MKRTMTLLVALTAPLVLMTGTAGAHQGGMSNTVTKVVKQYRITMTIGDAERMHMKGMQGSGETMLGGKNAACTVKGGMYDIAATKAAQACNHHVEVHVQNWKTKAVVTTARVAITMVNTSHPKTIHLPIATMLGSEGKADVHYGNNVYAPGGWYTITVKVNAVQTKFKMPILTHF